MIKPKLSIDKTMKKIFKIVKIATLVLFSGIFSSQLHINVNDPAYEYLV